MIAFNKLTPVRPHRHFEATLYHNNVVIRYTVSKILALEPGTTLDPTQQPLELLP